MMASDVATIMGVNPYETAHQLWLRMTGRTSPKGSNFAMQRGHKYEPVARALLEAEAGYKITPMCCESDGENGVPIWAGCSLDGRADNGKIYEIKVPGKQSLDDVANGICPAKWYPQLHWQMLVTGERSVTLAAYDPGDGVISGQPFLATMTVDWNAEYANELIAKVTAFREAVMRDEPIAGDKITRISVQWYKASLALDAAKERVEALQKQLVEAALAEGKKETPVATISESTRTGSLDYGKLLASLGYTDLPEEQLAPFRKPSTSVISVRKTTGAAQFLEGWERSLIEQGANEAKAMEAGLVEIPIAGGLSW